MGKLFLTALAPGNGSDMLMVLIFLLILAGIIGQTEQPKKKKPVYRSTDM